MIATLSTRRSSHTQLINWCFRGWFCLLNWCFRGWFRLLIWCFCGWFCLLRLLEPSVGGALNPERLF